MGNQRKTIATQMNAMHLAIDNTINDPEISAAVAKFGYHSERMLAGRQLYENAVQIVNQQMANIGAQQEAHVRTQTAKKLANQAYQSLAKVCRAIFQTNPAQLAALGLRGNTPRATAAFLISAYTLFGNAQQPKVQSELAHYGYDLKKLQTEREVIVAFDRANQKMALADGTKEQGTRDQDAALQGMLAWLKQYLKIARVALHDRPELLEKLGVRILSSKTAAQRGAKTKAAATRALKRGAKD